MAVTVTATVEAGNTPPRVRLDVVNTAPLFNEVTVGRLDPDGRSVPVRTGDGGPLQLTVSGSNKVGLIYDYEMPYSAPVQYGTNEGGLTSGVVTVPASRPWLIPPGVPELAVPITLRPGSLGEESFGVAQGVFSPLGRTNPVVITDGARKGSQSSMTVLTQTTAELTDLKELLGSASVLLLNVPADKNWGFDTAYIAVGDVQVRRLFSLLSDPHRDVVMPFYVVDRPAGGSQAERTYIDVLAENASYNTVLAGYATYLDLLAPTT